MKKSILALGVLTSWQALASFNITGLALDSGTSVKISCVGANASSSSSAGVVTVSCPAPTPSPTPSVTPTPSPSPSSSPSPTPSPTVSPSPGALSVRVSGSKLIDASGKALQLRGVNASALEFVSIQNYTSDPWGGQSPNFASIKGWKANVVRLPLHEASWLGLSCLNVPSGKMINADFAGNYKATVQKAVSDATAQGLYVILDLHWNAPNNAAGVPVCALTQNPMADADHSLAFWSSIASTFKSQPNVIFELFNEPYFYWVQNGADPWKVWKDGGTLTQYVDAGANYTTALNWQSAGMQPMLNVIRATGATNVVLVGGIDWTNDMTGWLANRPTDPLSQMAAAWHTYPGQAHAPIAANGPAVSAIVTAGFPVVITETGDPNSNGTVGSPYVSTLLPWADALGISYLGWTWDVWGDPANVLIKSQDGTPTDGYGVYFKTHLQSF